MKLPRRGNRPDPFGAYSPIRGFRNPTVRNLTAGTALVASAMAFGPSAARYIADRTASNRMTFQVNPFPGIGNEWNAFVNAGSWNPSLNPFKTFDPRYWLGRLAQTPEAGASVEVGTGYWGQDKSGANEFGTNANVRIWQDNLGQGPIPQQLQAVSIRITGKGHRVIQRGREIPSNSGPLAGDGIWMEVDESSVVACIPGSKETDRFEVVARLLNGKTVTVVTGQLVGCEPRNVVVNREALQGLAAATRTETPPWGKVHLTNPPVPPPNHPKPKHQATPTAPRPDKTPGQRWIREQNGPTRLIRGLEREHVSEANARAIIEALPIRPARALVLAERYLRDLGSNKTPDIRKPTPVSDAVVQAAALATYLHGVQTGNLEEIRRGANAITWAEGLDTTNPPATILDQHAYSRMHGTPADISTAYWLLASNVVLPIEGVLSFAG